ncbi:hypothetical protein FRB94_014250 [Tulasnella sp. JGI-2019a]|nr:hypothetical protein FRB93_005401 [Tulasnella sp. JGI-2019a]KAG9014157.1 hypothetical protein FRB94_014250 [Tulasnella sp. JGI-2019a]
MFIPTKVVSVLLAFAAVGFASPTSELAARSGPYNTVMINPGGYCMLAPRIPGMPIAVSGPSGATQSYCNHPTGGQGQMPPNFWTPTLRANQGIHGGPYVQLTGCINPGALGLNSNDPGGQYNSNGRFGEPGNPRGSACAGYAHYIERIEPANRRACIRCCQDPADCPINPEAACPAIIPGNYPGC